MAGSGDQMTLSCSDAPLSQEDLEEDWGPWRAGNTEPRPKPNEVLDDMRQFARAKHKQYKRAEPYDSVDLEHMVHIRTGAAYDPTYEHDKVMVNAASKTLAKTALYTVNLWRRSR